ncbi:Methyl-CpG-binding domain-containing protein 8 [Bienertia sinuspersici]
MAEGKFNEVELLKMLENIEGEWCSRRKKARVIDASLLGDALPLGWKLIVALRRKGGRFSPYCRRYISPTGDQFSSCKEVSSYLQSYFGINDAKLVRDNRVEFQQLQTVDSVNRMCINSEHDNFMLKRSNSTMHNTCAPIEHEKGASILDIENLSDVRVCDLYECHSCNISFDAKDKYLQHMFSLHQRTTKRYTLDSSVGDKVIIKDGKSERPKRKRRRKHGPSVADGVIMKNGKYGCQFCPKVFEERRRYLGHVGNHIKGSIKTPDSLVQVHGGAKAPCVDKSPTSINNSRMDALVEIAQSSIQEISTPAFEKESSSVNNVDRLSAAEYSQGMDADRKTKENSGSCLTEVDVEKGCKEGQTFSVELYPCEMVRKLSSVCNKETAREDFEEGKTLSQDLHPSCDRVDEMSIIDALNHLDPSPGEHDEEDIVEDRILSSELNPKGKMGGISRTDENIDVPTCPNEYELEKNVKDGNDLSTIMNPLAKMSKSSCSELNPQGKTAKIPRAVEYDNVATSYPTECELKKYVREGKTLSKKRNALVKMSKSSPSELNTQGKARKILRTDEEMNTRTSCPNECELGKTVKEGKTLSAELDPLSKTNKMLTTDEEIEGQYFICNIVDVKKDSCSEALMTPNAENGIAGDVSGNESCKSTVADDGKPADSPVGVNSIHYLQCKEKTSHPISSAERIPLEHMHICEPQNGQKYDESELVAVSGQNHASGCTVPQSLLNSSSTFDEIFEKAGQDICSLDQNLDSVSGVEYMKLDVIEPQMYKYNSMNQEDSISLYEVSMDLESNIGLGLELDNSVKSQPEFPQEMDGKCLTTTVCVWCGVEFSHEIVEVEPQPDSVGFMCPACRAKISKQFNELESNFSLSSHC